MFLFNRSSTFRILECISRFISNKCPSRGGAFIGEGRLIEGGVYLKKSQKRGAFIRGGRLKEGVFIRSITVAEFTSLLDNGYLEI